MKKDEHFMLDIYVKSDFDLSKFGLDAKAICLPRRSEGSIGIKTSNSELLYGDLLENTKNQPKTH